MSIEGFGFKEQFIGTDPASSAFEFDFRIFDPAQLHIYIQDQFGNILTDTTGDDSSIVSSVTFDESGGILTLVTPLGNNFVLTMFMANDYPDQPTEFPNKFSFTFDIVEGAFDFIMACVQRVAYLAQRSIRLHDLDDQSSWDFRLPINLSTFPNGVLCINAEGNGFAVNTQLGAITATMADAIAQCLAAEVAAQNFASDSSMRADDSNSSATAAEAALTAILTAIAAYPVVGGQFTRSGPFAAIAPNANLNLPGETTNPLVFTMIEYTARIKRGAATYAKQRFTIFYRNAAWEIALEQDTFADAGADHNVTFTVDPVTAQINAAVANDGGSNAIIDLTKISWPI